MNTHWSAEADFCTNLGLSSTKSNGTHWYATPPSGFNLDRFTAVPSGLSSIGTNPLTTFLWQERNDKRIMKHLPHTPTA